MCAGGKGRTTGGVVLPAAARPGCTRPRNRRSSAATPATGRQHAGSRRSPGAQPVQRRPVELGGPADEVVHLRLEWLAVGVARSPPSRSRRWATSIQFPWALSNPPCRQRPSRCALGRNVASQQLLWRAATDTARRVSRAPRSPELGAVLIPRRCAGRQPRAPRTAWRHPRTRHTCGPRRTALVLHGVATTRRSQPRPLC